MQNVYENPKAYGLEVITVIELTEPDYSFDLLAVWKGENGYYLGTDSGCSCPIPFENFDGVEDLTGPLTAEGAREEATSLWGGYDKEEFEKSISLIV